MLKDVEVANVALGLARKGGKFTTKDFVKAVDKFKHPNPSLVLSHLKAGKVIDNPVRGEWILIGKGDDVNAEILNKFSRMFKNKREKKKTKMIGSGKTRIKSPITIQSVEKKSSSAVNILNLILEIRAINPKADIAVLAAML